MSQFDPYGSSSSATPAAHSSRGGEHPVYTTTGTTSPNLNTIDQTVVQFFINQGYTRGLLQHLLAVKPCYFQRCWIVDNGNGMLVQDSHKLLIDNTNGSIQTVDEVRRWDELLESISTQAWISSYLDMPMRFALLNKPATNNMTQYFTMGESDDIHKSPQEKVQKVGQILNIIQPHGPTNLTKQIQIIHGYVSSILHQLQSNNQKMSVVIATQGLPTNDNGESNPQITQEFVNILTALGSLPVSITLRLCTDDEHVFHFYNTLVNSLHSGSSPKLEFDVIDDYSGEALEVFLKNPWLTYGLSLHRFRELGLFVNVLASLDEHLLTLDELHEFCSIIFESNNTIPHPRTHWSLFLQAITILMQKELKQWNPVKKKFAPWIDIYQLEQMYGKYHNENTTTYQQQQQQQQPFHSREGQQYAHHQHHPSTTNSSTFSNMHPQKEPQPPAADTQPPPSQTTQRTPANPTTLNTPPTPVDETSIKKNLLMKWALQAPSYQTLKPVTELLATVQIAFPPAFGIDEHTYFKKWKVLSLEGLSSGGENVVKRAHRKAKFLLHPDKLPKDLDKKQLFVCKLIWDVLNDAWGIYESG